MTEPKYFIGIDLHKTVIQVCVLDDKGELSEEFRLRLETPEDGQEALRRLIRWRTTGRFVVEAVGLDRWFVNGCQAAGLRSTVADVAKLGLKHLGRKTDRRDAQGLQDLRLDRNNGLFQVRQLLEHHSKGNLFVRRQYQDEGEVALSLISLRPPRLGP